MIPPNEKLVPPNPKLIPPNGELIPPNGELIPPNGWLLSKYTKKHTALSDVEELIPPKPILNTTKRKT